MKVFLFLDDWFLDGRIDAVRCYANPEPEPVLQPHRLGVSTIIYDPEQKKFRAWAKIGVEKQARLYESPNGIDWHVTRHRMAVFPRQNFYEQNWFYDTFDPDPDRRHKMLVWPYEKNTYGGPGLVATSPDGIRWTNRPDMAWSPPQGRGSDTRNNIFYNPLSKQWSVICRKWHADRRVAMVTSPDLHQWSQPKVLLQPDTLDAPLQQFYGMSVLPYENDWFIGFLQCYHVPQENGGCPGEERLSMHGYVDTQLVHSIDGECWVRGPRTPFLDRTSPGTYGGGSLYGCEAAAGPDGRILIFARGTLRQHGNADLPKGYPARSGLLVYPLRRDGFAYLTPVGRQGTVTTRPLVPEKGKLTLNVEAPLGQVRVRAEAPDGSVYPGYSFHDCSPVTGDQTEAVVRWGKRRGLTGLVGKPLRLTFRLTDARLYAFRLQCGVWYTTTAEPLDHV